MFEIKKQNYYITIYNKRKHLQRRNLRNVEWGIPPSLGIS